MNRPIPVNQWGLSTYTHHGHNCEWGSSRNIGSYASQLSESIFRIPSTLAHCYYVGTLLYCHSDLTLTTFDYQATLAAKCTLYSKAISRLLPMMRSHASASLAPASTLARFQSWRFQALWRGTDGQLMYVRLVTQERTLKYSLNLHQEALIKPRQYSTPRFVLSLEGRLD